METAKGFEKERYIMTVNQLAVLRNYLETISQYESFIRLNNSFGIGRYYEDYYNVLNNSSIIYFLENGEKISSIRHLFEYSELDFPLDFLEKSLVEVDQFGDWLHSQLTLETDCWAVTHEVYRLLNGLRIRIRKLIEERTEPQRTYQEVISD